MRVGAFGCCGAALSRLLALATVVVSLFGAGVLYGTVYRRGDSAAALGAVLAAAGARSLPAITAIQATLDCWAHEGRWEPDAGLWADPCMLNSSACFGLSALERRVEIGQRWTVPAACNASYAYRSLHTATDALIHALTMARTLVSGDSMTQDMFEAMEDLVLCKSGVRLRNAGLDFARAVRLQPDEGPGKTSDLTDRLARTADPYAFFVVNKGAHFRNDTEFFDTYAKSIHRLLAHSPNALILVRNTPVGHRDCHTFRNSPPLDAAVAAQLVSETAATLGQHYAWGQILRQNTQLRAFLHATCPHNCLLLDVVPATSQRADSHKMPLDGVSEHVDCLHYCYPGPLDMWADLIANTVLMLTS